MAIAMLNGTLATISIHYQPAKLSTGSGSDEPDSPNSTHSKLPATPDRLYERHASLTPLANMSSARCGFGLCVVGDKMLACGQYLTPTNSHQLLYIVLNCDINTVFML